MKANWSPTLPTGKLTLEVRLLEQLEHLCVNTGMYVHIYIYTCLILYMMLINPTISWDH